MMQKSKTFGERNRNVNRNTKVYLIKSHEQCICFYKPCNYEIVTRIFLKKTCLNHTDIFHMSWAQELSFTIQNCNMTGVIQQAGASAGIKKFKNSEATTWHALKNSVVYDDSAFIFYSSDYSWSNEMLLLKKHLLYRKSWIRKHL